MGHYVEYGPRLVNKCLPEPEIHVSLCSAAVQIMLVPSNYHCPCIGYSMVNITVNWQLESRDSTESGLQKLKQKEKHNTGSLGTTDLYRSWHVFP